MIIIFDHHDREQEPGRDRDIGPRRSLDMGLGRDRHWDMGPGHLRIPSSVNSHARLQLIEDQEVVLQERLVQILIKLRTYTDKLKQSPYGEGVYCMQPRVRVWSRDNSGYAKVRRIGFSVAPEFGGTIHGYCGDTLDAALLDLLEWNGKPTIDDQYKAYVGRSRTRQVEDTLLVQPYSPWLFRQGELALSLIHI